MYIPDLKRAFCTRLPLARSHVHLQHERFVQDFHATRQVCETSVPYETSSTGSLIRAKTSSSPAKHPGNPRPSKPQPNSMRPNQRPQPQDPLRLPPPPRRNFCACHETLLHYAVKSLAKFAHMWKDFAGVRKPRIVYEGSMSP